MISDLKSAQKNLLKNVYSKRGCCYEKIAYGRQHCDNMVNREGDTQMGDENIINDQGQFKCYLSISNIMCNIGRENTLKIRKKFSSNEVLLNKRQMSVRLSVCLKHPFRVDLT